MCRAPKINKIEIENTKPRGRRQGYLIVLPRVLPRCITAAREVEVDMQATTGGAGDLDQASIAIGHAKALPAISFG